MVSHDCVAFDLLSEGVSQHVKVVQSRAGRRRDLRGLLLVPAAAGGRRRRPRGLRARSSSTATHDALAALLGPTAGGSTRTPACAFAAEHFARPGADEPVDRALRLDSEMMLVDDPVKRVDNMTMAWGLEARVPFLDHDLVELAAACPPELKLAHGGKGVLKAAGAASCPAEVIDRPKGYFPVPALTHLEGKVLELVRDALPAPTPRATARCSTRRTSPACSPTQRALTPLRGNSSGSSACSSSGCRSRASDRRRRRSWLRGTASVIMDDVLAAEGPGQRYRHDRALAPGQRSGVIGRGGQKLLGWFGGEGLRGTVEEMEMFRLTPARPLAATAAGSEFGAG